MPPPSTESPLPLPDDVLAQIRELIRPALERSGVELFDAHWDGRSHPATLRLLIDSAAGVTLDDCERVSSTVEAVLDAYDPIADTYLLEVSSPGAERPLRSLDEWRRSVGKRVNVRYRAGDAEVIVEGRLAAVDGDAVEVETRPRRRRVPHPRELVEGAPVPPAPTAVPVRVALGDVVAGRLAVEM